MTMTADYQDTPMFGVDGVIDDDTARARRSDPTTSHNAADRSGSAILEVRRNVLRLVRENPLIIGNELNDLYKQVHERRGWVPVAWDGPRKRAGEMADPEKFFPPLLLLQGERNGARQFIISAAGLDLIA